MQRYIGGALTLMSAIPSSLTRKSRRALCRLSRFAYVAVSQLGNKLIRICAGGKGRKRGKKLYETVTNVPKFVATKKRRRIT